MATGLTSKILIFVVIMYVGISFIGNSGFLGSEYETSAMAERVNKITDNARASIEGMDVEGATGTILEAVFNPILYIVDALGFLLGVFTDPLIFASKLPAPFSEIMMGLFSVLNIGAVISVFRGVQA